MIENPYLAGNFAPVLEEHTAIDLTVAGQIPEELAGRWLRNGPNPVGDVDADTHHWFSGDGMVHGIRLRDGRAEWYRNRWVRSTQVAQQLGEVRSMTTRNGDRNFGANTHVSGFAGKTYAMVEGGAAPVELTYELDTVDSTDFGGTLPNGFTAHPKYDPLTRELHAMVYTWPDLVDHIQYVVVGRETQPDGTSAALVNKVVDIPVPQMPMVHDMSLTSNYAVVYDLSVGIDLNLFGRTSIPFGWMPDKPSRVGLLPRSGGAESIIWCDVPPCALFHPLNAYDTVADDGSARVIIDICRYDTLFDSDIRGPLGDSPSKLVRWTINPNAATVSEDVVDGRSHEFPRHNPMVGTMEHRFGYTAGGTSNREATFGSSLLGSTFKTDFRSGNVAEFDHGEGRQGAEPVFVGRQGATDEDDGWLLVTVYDATTNTSDLVILDARDLGAAEVARISLPARIPHGFHGDWVPDTSVAPPE